MTIGVLVFSLVAALVIGVLGALVFTVICVGFALLILLPTLFVTTFAGAFIWLWGVGAYYILKWFNKKDIPGVNGPVGESMGLPALGGGDEQRDEEKAGKGKKEADGTPKKAHPNGSAEKSDGGSGDKGQVNGTVEKVTGGDKVGDVGKATGADVPGVGDVKKKANVGTVGNVKDSVPGGVL